MGNSIEIMSHDELLKQLGTLSWRRAGQGAESSGFRSEKSFQVAGDQVDAGDGTKAGGYWTPFKETKHCEPARERMRHTSPEVESSLSWEVLK